MCAAGKNPCSFFFVQTARIRMKSTGLFEPKLARRGKNIAATHSQKCMHCLVQPVCCREISSANELKICHDLAYLHIRNNITHSANLLPLPKPTLALLTGLFTQKTQPLVSAALYNHVRKPRMRAAGHSSSSVTQQCYRGSACARQLADLFLHAGSGCRRMTEATNTSEAAMNDLSLLLWSEYRLLEMTGRDSSEKKLSILSLPLC